MSFIKSLETFVALLTSYPLIQRFNRKIYCARSYFYTISDVFFSDFSRRNWNNDLDVSYRQKTDLEFCFNLCLQQNTPYNCTTHLFLHKDTVFFTNYNSNQRLGLVFKICRLSMFIMKIDTYVIKICWNIYIFKRILISRKESTFYVVAAGSLVANFKD